MALSPEDILSKRFLTTKFREGYDQDEVDDFLDEVVLEFRRVLSENQELKTGSGAKIETLVKGLLIQKENIKKPRNN